MTGPAWLPVAATLVVAAPLLLVLLLGRLPGVPAAWQKPALHSLLAATFLCIALLVVFEDQRVSWLDLLAFFVMAGGAVIFAVLAGIGAGAARRSGGVSGELR